MRTKRRTKFEIAKPKVLGELRELAPVFTFKRLRELVSENRVNWGLSKTTTASEVIQFLGAEGLRELRLSSKDYGPQRRYAWEGVSPLLVALSMRPHAYLSHSTAAFVHGLTDNLAKTIYVNAEQSPKPAHSGALTQEGIDRAFARAQRATNYVFSWDGWKVAVLSGKNTGRLEVGRFGEHDELGGWEGDVTKLERTLIDIVVRPAYSGGVHEVLEAYRRAREAVSTNVLVRTLTRLGYSYPYHQAIGFFMERAGYTEGQWGQLRKMGLRHDFYLTHGMKKTDYSEKWRLFFPKGF